MKEQQKRARTDGAEQQKEPLKDRRRVASGWATRINEADASPASAVAPLVRRGSSALVGMPRENGKSCSLPSLAAPTRAPRQQAAHAAHALQYYPAVPHQLQMEEADGRDGIGHIDDLVAHLARSALNSPNYRRRDRSLMLPGFSAPLMPMLAHARETLLVWSRRRHAALVGNSPASDVVADDSSEELPTATLHTPGTSSAPQHHADERTGAGSAAMVKPRS